MSKPMKTTNKGRDVVVPKELWEELGLRQAGDRAKIQDMEKSVTEALNTCRELAQDNDKLEEKLASERKLSDTKIIDLEGELETAIKSLELERRRSKDLLEAFGDVARSVDGVSGFSRRMFNLIEDADLVLVAKEKVKTR